MTRQEAEITVAPYVCRVEQFAAVSCADAMLLLGSATYDDLCADPIRNLGPNANTFYPWNVVDYLVDPLLGKKRLERRQGKA